MRITLRAVVALCVHCACVSSSAQTRLTVVADPGPLGSVERAAGAERLVDWRDGDDRDDRACTESFAACEVRRCLAEALSSRGARVELSDALRDSGDVVIVGGVLDRWTREGLDTLGAPRFASRDDQCFRMFRSRLGDRRAWVIQGRGRAGTLYGCYAFLERCGWHWNGLGPGHTLAPEAGAPLPDTLAVSESPGFTSRGAWAFEPRGTPELLVWMARNRLNLWTDRDSALVPMARKLAIRLVGGGHDIQKACLDPSSRVDGRRLFDVHPDWFGLQHGRRSDAVTAAQGDNFCTSNPLAVRAFCDGVVRELEGGRWRNADALALWMHDDGHWCTCAPCSTLGTPTDRMIRLLGQVERAAREANASGVLKRRVRFSSLAFLETLPPPTRANGPLGDDVVMTYFPIDRCYAHGLGDTTCTEINRDLDATFRRWAARPNNGPAIGVGEYYNLSDIRSLPLVLTRVIGEDVRYYYASGVRDFRFMHILHRDWGPWALDYVVLARMLWNPHARSASIRRAFIAETYPTTAATMDTFYNALEVASANFKLLKGRVVVNGRKTYQLGRQIRLHLEPFPLEHMGYWPETRWRNNAPDIRTMLATMATARQALARARARVREPREAARLAALQRRFDYGDATLTFIAQLVQAYLSDARQDRPGAERAVAALTREGARLRAMVDVVQVSSAHANAANGLQATGLVPLYEELRRRYGR